MSAQEAVVACVMAMSAAYVIGAMAKTIRAWWRSR